MTVKLTDAFSRWTYEKTADGKALVTTPIGETGLFNPDATWFAGEVTDANLHIIGFLCGRHATRDPGLPDPGTRFARTADD